MLGILNKFNLCSNLLLFQWFSQDPLLASGQVAMPQSWNRYTYVLNNPLNMTDPLGLYNVGGGTAEDNSQDPQKRPDPTPVVITDKGLPPGTTVTITPIGLATDAEAQDYMSEGNAETRQARNSRGTSLADEFDQKQVAATTNPAKLMMSAASYLWAHARLPDFYQVEVDIPIDPEMPFLGIALQGTVSRNGGIYLGGGGYAGLPGWNATGGYLTRPNSVLPSFEKPSEDETDDFIKDLSLGGSFTRGPVSFGATASKVKSGYRGAYQLGTGSPGGAISVVSNSKLGTMAWLGRVLNH